MGNNDSMSIAALEILERASFTPAQVKAIAQFVEEEQRNYSGKVVLREEYQVKQEQTATREDILKLDAKTEAAIHKLDAKIDDGIHKLDIKLTDTKTELIQWMFGLLMAQSALLLTVMRYIPH